MNWNACRDGENQDRICAKACYSSSNFNEFIRDKNQQLQDRIELLNLKITKYDSKITLIGNQQKRQEADCVTLIGLVLHIEKWEAEMKNKLIRTENK